MIAFNQLIQLALLSGLFSFCYAQESELGSHRGNITNSSFVIIQPTGEEVDDLPEMVALPDTSQLYRSVTEIIDQSFIREAIDIYFLAQTYLKNKNEITEIEPAYLALTKNQGGFAKFGFRLLDGERHIDKSKAPYVEVTEDRATVKPDKLMSLTQLYPHELGHILYRLLSASESREEKSKNMDMHYFSVITDYGIAFNEGFAEHLENVSRLYEKNERITSGIQRDVERIRSKSPYYIGGFERDMRYPFRFCFYKASMVMWYQQFENLIRYEHALNGSVKYKNATADVDDVEDQLTFRNSGVRKDKKSMRNLVQALATEGVVSAFFTKLCQSQLANIYQPASFYKAFLNDAALVMQTPEKMFSPIQNLFLKYFVVLYEYVKLEQSQKSQLTDFVDGYVHTFPAEAETIKKIFKEVTGLDYSNNLPPQIWLLIKTHNHRLLVLDAFGAITFPAYTFDLNAAEVEDLLTIRGVQKSDAQKIIAHREVNGFFHNLQQIQNIPDVTKESVDRILACTFDEEYFDSLSEPQLTITSLLMVPLEKILMRGALYFLLIFSVVYGMFLRKEKFAFKKVALSFFLHFLGWMFIIAAGLISVILSGNALIIFLPTLVVSFIMLRLFYRKDEQKVKQLAMTIGFMALLVIISLV